MSQTVKIVLACVVAKLAADAAVKSFTNSGDSESETMAWGIGAAALIGVAAAKLL